MIITFLIGICFNNTSGGHSIITRFTVLLLGGIPFILSIIAMVMCLKKPNRFNNFFGNIFMIIGLIIYSLLYYISAMVICILIEFSEPITDVNYYKKIVWDELLTFFPKDIPQNVTDARLYYYPNLLQSGSKLHLYYIDRNMNNKIFTEKYQDMVVNDDKDFSEDYRLSPLLENRKDLDDFTIFLLKNKCANSDNFCHKEIILVGFNEKTNELIYIYDYQ